VIINKIKIGIRLRERKKEANTSTLALSFWLNLSAAEKYGTNKINEFTLTSLHDWHYIAQIIRCTFVAFFCFYSNAQAQSRVPLWNRSCIMPYNHPIRSPDIWHAQHVVTSALALIRKKNENRKPI